MKPLALALALATLPAGPLAAQVFDTLPARGFTPDLAIPDAPAYEMLGARPSTLLRPNTVQDLAVIFSEFREADGSFRLPASLAVEFAPLLLMAGPDLQKRSYAEQKALYALRLSFGVLTDTATDALSNLALGFRYTVRNEADLRGDADFDEKLQVTGYTEQILAVYQAARDRVGPQAPLALTPAEEEQIEEIQEAIAERWAARYWNASGIDLALAFRGSTLDASGTDPEITAYGLWGTYSTPLGRWGQVVLGARAGGERNRNVDDFTQLMAVGLRLNVGSNAYKFFTSFENAFRESEEAQMRGSLGIELRIADWVWGDFSLGFRDDAGDLRTEATAKLKTAFPRI